jgi:hypothetical protein
MVYLFHVPKQICALTMLQNKEPHQYIRRGSFQLTDTK